MTDRGVIHGRFQVLHNDHVKYLLAGRERCKHLIVGITNPDPTLSREDQADRKRSTAFANPLTYFERYTMLRAALAEAGMAPDEFSVVPFPINLPELYACYVPMDAVFFLTICDDWGRRKLSLLRESGLATEILWEKPNDEKGISGAEVRRRIASGEPWADMVPPSTRLLIEEWNLRDRLRKLDPGAQV